MIEKYHVPPALKTEEESKLLVSVSNKVVFLEALDKSFKSYPISPGGAYASCKDWPSW